MLQMPLFWQYVVGALVVCGLVAVGVGKETHRNWADSFLYGLFLGPLGILLVALLPPVAPKGMKSVRCARCNAVQNIPYTDKEFVCWQCQHTVHA
jgi:hypothetical protein